MSRSKITLVKVLHAITLLSVGLAAVLLLDGCGGASRASQEETAQGRSSTFFRLELSPTRASGVGGTATFTKAATGTKIHLKLRGLPEPYELYLAHLHPGSCEDEESSDTPEGEAADRHSHEPGHQQHAYAHARVETKEATTEEIEHPLTPVESDAAGHGSSTTVLEGVALGELFRDGSKYLNVHAAGSGDLPHLVCANLGEAS